MPQQIELRNIALQAAQPLVHGVSLTPATWACAGVSRR